MSFYRMVNHVWYYTRWRVKGGDWNYSSLTKDYAAAHEKYEALPDGWNESTGEIELRRVDDTTGTDTRLVFRKVVAGAGD